MDNRATAGGLWREGIHVLARGVHGQQIKRQPAIGGIAELFAAADLAAPGPAAWISTAPDWPAARH